MYIPKEMDTNHEQAAIQMSSKAIHIDSTTVSALCQAAILPGKLV